MSNLFFFIMKAIYLITSPIDSDAISVASTQLQVDLSQGYVVQQLFFYADSVAVGAVADDYPDNIQVLIDVAEAHHLPLYLCSAAFQKRKLHLSELGEQDFAFKGLGQFVSEMQSADLVRQF